MKIPLSPRLAACCARIQPGDRVADIGCDHGYLGIYLLNQGIASSVLASDIRPGPLDAAKRNALKYGVQGSIRFFLSNGLASLPREYDVVVCAGMGADVMVSILENAPWLHESGCRLVLQCQSRTEYLRSYLAHSGWDLVFEDVFRDGRFLYTVMECRPGASYTLSPGEAYLSSPLRGSKSPVLGEYVKRQISRLEKAVKNGAGDTTPALPAALQELQAYLQQKL